MKSLPILIGPTIALTVLFYLLAYFLLPPPPPTAPLVFLFAAISISLIWIVRAIYRARTSARQQPNKPQKQPNVAPSLVLILALASLTAATSCSSAPRSAPPASPAPAPTMSPAPPPPAPSAAMPRVTGTAFLLTGQDEDAGYGLYSYALLSHAPEASDQARYHALIRALLDLPTAADLTHTRIVRTRINITYMLVKSTPPTQSSLDAQTDYILAHYDYARGAVLLASLPQKTGPGPVIVSVLQPMSVTAIPHPVLVQDLSTAQPTLMADYVTSFKNQVAQQQFWQPQALSAFALTLRNLLETAATGLGMSQDAVKSWIQFSH
jgi:hypothetical protein